MRTRHSSLTILMAGILSLAVSGCGNSGGGGAGPGGSTSGAAGSGGVAAGGSSGGSMVSNAGSIATGGAGAGGIVGTAGSSSGVRTGGSGSGGTVGTAGYGGILGTGGIATGGTSGGGGAIGTGGSKGTGGTPETGGRGTGGSVAGGTAGTTTEGTGGRGTVDAGSSGGSTGAAGRVGTGGAMGTGGRSGGGATGAAGVSGTGGSTTGAAGSTGSGTCTASKSAGVTASGSGSHKVTVESNSDAQISCGTIYRPTDLGGTEKYPIFVWGEGGCSRSGTSNTAAMGEIASHGYFVVADGPSGGGGSSCGSISMPSSAADLPNMAKPMLGYITWAIAENSKPCSAYYQSLDTTKVAADGFSCGGLMAEATAGDSRMTAWGVSSSGLTSPDQSFYKTIHTPVKILLGGSTDVAYTNGERDYDNISALGIPIILFSKSGAGHGGDLSVKNGGDFTKVNLAWLNWQLKDDETATGKGFLVGSSCTFCSNSAWEVKSKNLP